MIDNVVEVNKDLADDILSLNDYLEERNIEMEIINEVLVVVSILYNKASVIRKQKSHQPIKEGGIKI